MQSSTPSQQTFQDESQDMTSEGNDLPVEVHGNDRGLRSFSLQANSTLSVPTQEAIKADSANRLPVEILSEIFLTSTHILDQSELHQMDSHDIPPRHRRLMFARNAVPCTISSVCKRWRSIGLSTPRLWSKLTILQSDCQLEKFMVALRTWLKRSKDHPLEFTCLSGYKQEEEILVELFKHIHRWHVAYFGNPGASYFTQQKQLFTSDGLKAESLVTLEVIQNKSKRHIAFSKRKAGIMKKAYELSTLTGTQVLLLVVSETGDVYSFTTSKLEPLVTQPEGRNLIRGCLNANIPHSSVTKEAVAVDVSDGDVSDQTPSATPSPEHSSIQDPDGSESESGGEDDEDYAITTPSDNNTGNKKIRIEFIQANGEGRMAWSQEKAEIMKKAYELSTLTGTQVLLLVVSETGLISTFATAELGPLITQPEGKNLIQNLIQPPIPVV